jgi:hypothetical protein
MIWPDDKRFALTIFDDPDSQDEQQSQLIYSFLADLGFRTTKAVWPLGPLRETNSPGTTCGDHSFRAHCQDLQRDGFEIGFHNAAPHSCTRQETIEALDLFRQYFGRDPVVMANHYNADAMYWGPARLDGIHRQIYTLITLGRTRNRHFGEIPGHPAFWGDICRERIRYCRNFVFPGIDTLGALPTMPYYDPRRPYVRAWYTSTDGHNCQQFLKAIAEESQDQLEASGGACIMYTHFGHWFVENGKLNATFQRLMKRLAAKRGYFVPTGTLLEYLERAQGLATLIDRQSFALQSRWMWGKLLLGAS